MKPGKLTKKREPELSKIFVQKSGIVFFLIFSLFALNSCSDDDDELTDCTSTQIEYVEDVTAPDSGEVFETIDIEVEFTVNNSCGEFNRFVDSGTEESRIIEVEAIYVGCYCEQVIEEKTATYEFEADEPGDYQLNFRSGEDEFITVDLTIQ